LVFFGVLVLGLTAGGLLVDFGEAGASVGAGGCWLGAPGEGHVDGSAELAAGESARARGSWLAAGRERGEGIGRGGLLVAGMGMEGVEEGFGVEVGGVVTGGGDVKGKVSYVV